MTGQLRVEVQSHGTESQGSTVLVEVMDAKMRTVAERWAQTPGSLSLDLDPGTYGVRVSVTSGRHIDRVVEVADADRTDVRIPLYALSPHEGHEWAYFGHQISEPGQRALTDRPFEGAWLRLWERSEQGWRTVPVPESEVQRLTDDSDGITYSFNPGGHRPYLLQTGGQEIPWRFTALPPSHRVMAMIKPAAADADYPLDVVLASENPRLQTLLSLLQSSEVSKAREWGEESGIAEELLYGKIGDPAAAAVGGYFLLRVRNFDRLHDWANNLANWIDWMADGPIIHAWQLFAQADAQPAQREDLTRRARSRLLEAVNRGVPLYTEGLRLLRDGLLGLHRMARGEDAEVKAALEHAGKYTAASDPTMPTTTFLGGVPDRPDEAPPEGLPDDGGPMMFVSEVPLRELLRERLIEPGESLRAQTGEGIEAVVREDGTLELADGRAFGSLAELEAGIGGRKAGHPWSWKVESRGETLHNLCEPFRRATFERTKQSGESGTGRFGAEGA